MNYGIFIPARYQSSRFPGKPLVDLCGKTMIQRVWEKGAEALGPQKVFIATDSEDIRHHCQQWGGNVIMTSPKCLTGTDRVYEAIKDLPFDVAINVQGDEPLIQIGDIIKVVEKSQQYPDQVVNAYCPITSEEDFRSPNVPKVVVRMDGRLLYMGRGPIPSNKSQEFIKANKQVCIYAFPKKLLKKFYEYGKKTPLESIEDVEILRFLELGFDVHMVEVSGNSVAVDTKEDAERVRKLLSN